MKQFLTIAVVLLVDSALLAQSLSVPAPELPPWCPVGVGCSTEVQTQVNGTLVSGNATLRMGQDGLFDRPLLLVEGFDFGAGWSEELHGHGSVTWNGIYGGDAVNFPMGLEYRPMLDELYAQGADVVFLDFASGTASLEDKAALLSFVMSMIQDFKEGHAPSVLVGVSMGGLVGRIALTQWEHAGMPHCMGQFYTVDSPHFGATMPVGLQALVLALSGQSSQGELLWNALNSSASRQLLQHHIAGNDAHQAAMALLEQHGWPQTSVNLAIINSRPDAQATLTDSPLLHMEWGIGSPLNYQLAHVTADRWGGSGSAGGANLSLPGTLWPGDDVPLFQDISVEFPQPEQDPESVPGATAGHLELLANALSSSFPLDLLSEHVQSDVTFVPYTSAMASTPSCPQGPWTATSIATPAMPRETHASLPSHHRQWMMGWIQALWDQEWPNTIQQQDPVMTLGWNQPKRNLVQEMLIEAGGKLVVGNNATPFEAITSSCEGEIRVHHAGEIHVGSEQGAIGQLSISNGTDLTIGEEGRVVVHEGSTLTVLPHATLNLEAGQLDIRPGGQIVVLQSGRIVLDDGAAINLSEGATWQHGGHLNVLANQTSKVHLDGIINWKTGGKMWVGSSGGCEWILGNMACSRFDSDVTWSGNGQVSMEGGQGEFLPQGQLSTHVSLLFQDMQWTGLSGSLEHLQSTKDVTLRNCHLGMFRWRHLGCTEDAGLVTMEDNHWDVGWGQLHQAQLRAWDNTFDHVTMHVVQALSPSRMVGNRWNQTWFSNDAALILESCPSPVWLESNAWLGGRGTHLHHANATFACNAWENCTEAILLEGTGQSCFSASCGGGGNAWTHNDVHFELTNAALPLLSGGHNHLGPVSDKVAKGTTSSNVEDMHILEGSWDISLLDNPLLSMLSTSVSHCVAGDCEDVTWWANGMVLPRDCQAFPDPKPVKRKTNLSGTWNVLGQEVPTPPQ